MGKCLTPITHRALQDKLVKIAKKLKKNNVAVDIVSFGASDENEEKFEAFHSAVNSSSNSNLVTVPPGPALTDVLISSPIFQQEGSGYGGGGGEGGGGEGGGGDGFEFGVDPNLDPELALALRVSLEEERARQNAAAAAAGDGEAPPGEDKPVEATGEGAPATGEDTEMYLTEDDLLQQALAMSMVQELPPLLRLSSELDNPYAPGLIWSLTESHHLPTTAT